ncbi:sensor domain-containing diguanylate cyclase [Photobacterium angustum]|uniref:diguanylate cyclase n=1 Tax=Photobacterium angustum TaxID=661 RepID=A0A2S7VYM1_PHOAN|nr:sensor domain-containing diguanylate cyclase [Photobacterium angustum]PQJ67199.1 sensor domain-containing diguanylate cyclase [Photobacterium angustum]
MDNKFKVRITHSGFAILLALFLFLIVIELLFFNNKNKHNILIDKDTANISQTITTKINEQINSMVVSLKALSYSLNIQNSKNTKAFDEIAKKVMADNDVISELQYAPRGIITDIYPNQTKHSAIGHDLTHIEERKKGVLLSIENRSVSLIGPVKLIQNGKLAFILRLPLFNEKNEFTGFVNAISYLDTFREKLALDKSYYKILGFNPDGHRLTIFNNLEKTCEKTDNSFTVKVPNGEWLFVIQNQQKIHQDNSIYLRCLLYIFSCLICVYVYKREMYLKQSQNSILDMNMMLQKASYTDELTHLPNRRLLNEKLDAISTLTNNQTYSIAIFDIDNFKQVNDTYGHDVGDDVLVAFANICLSSIRSTDIIARWGGEEFVLLMENTDSHYGQEICTRILHTLSQHRITSGDSHFSVTSSVGLCEFTTPDFTITGVMKCIDEALYVSKKTGKNKVTLGHLNANK